MTAGNNTDFVDDVLYPTIFMVVYWGGLFLLIWFGYATPAHGAEQPRCECGLLPSTECLTFCSKGLLAPVAIKPAPPPVVIRKDFGGVLRVYLERYKELENTRIIVDGECNSGCTLVLMNRNVCATDRAFFYFHAARDATTGEFRADGTALLWARYPQKVKDWIAAQGGLTMKWIGVKATVLLPLCKEAKVS